MRSFEYKSPQENKVEEDLGEPHTFKVYIDGKVAGVGIVDYFSKPLPIYQLTTLYSEIEFQKQGVATEILDKVEQWAKARKKPVMLVDAIIDEEVDEHGNKAKGMYARRGWIEIEGQYGRHVYNWPKNVSTDVLKGFECRYTDYLERGNK